MADCRRFTLTLMAVVFLIFSGTLAHAQQFEAWKDDRPTKAPAKACAGLRALTGYEFSDRHGRDGAGKRRHG